MSTQMRIPSFLEVANIGKRLDRRNPVLAAIAAGDLDALVRLRNAHALDDNNGGLQTFFQYRDTVVRNFSLLHWAVYFNQQEIAVYLLQNHVNINDANTKHGQSPLHWAAKRGYVNLLAFLVAEGASMRHVDQLGNSALHHSVQHGHLLATHFLVQQDGMDVNAIDYEGRTPLHWASIKNHTQLVLYLLNQDAKVNVQDASRNTALHYAAYRGYSEVCKLLVEFGASHLLDGGGMYPEQCAARGRNGSLAKWLSKARRRGLDRVIPQMERKPWKRYAFLALPFVALPLLLHALMVLRPLFVAPLLAVYAMAYVYLQPWLAPVRSSDSLFPLGLTLASMLFSYAGYAAYLLPLTATYTMTHIFLHLCGGAALYLIYKTHTLDAGRVPLISANSYEFGDEGLEHLKEHVARGMHDDEFCGTCLIRRPIRSKHCRVCGRCMGRFDHHCSWLANCIAFNNHVYFVALLVALQLCLVLALALCYAYVSALTERPAMFNVLSMPFFLYRRHSHIFVALLMWCTLCYWNTNSLVRQARGIRRNLTTNEMVNWRKYSYLQNKYLANASAPTNANGSLSSTPLPRRHRLPQMHAAPSSSHHNTYNPPPLYNQFDRGSELENVKDFIGLRHDDRSAPVDWRAVYKSSQAGNNV